jgi:GNAT superfamily N-acetyltransferase
MTPSGKEAEGSASRLRLARKPLAMLRLLIAAPRPENPALRALLNAHRDISVAPLMPGDNVADFSCGVGELDAALRRDVERAPSAEPFACYAVRANGRIAGFYRLRCSSIDGVLPDGTVDTAVQPLPIVELPRLAVDRSVHGTGLGTALLADALLRSPAAGSAIGADALYVHALSEAERPFYARHGLTPVPAMIDPLGFVAPAAQIRQAMNSCPAKSGP